MRINSVGTMIATLVAQTPPAAPEDKAPPAKKAPSKKAAASKEPTKVIRMSDMKVEGKIQKPQAYYFLPRSSLNIDAMKLDESLVPKIFKDADELLER